MQALWLSTTTTYEPKESALTCEDMFEDKPSRDGTRILHDLNYESAEYQVTYGRQSLTFRPNVVRMTHTCDVGM
jgi:hypothetical protein